MHICINTIEKSMQTARSDKNTDSCPKTFNKSVTGYNSATQVKYYKKRKLEKSFFSMLFLKHLKDVKFTVDGSASHSSIFSWRTAKD